MTTTYEQLHDELKAQRESLLADLQELDARAKQWFIGYETHPADAGTYAFDQAAEQAMRNNIAKTLREVEEALKRFEKGTYGVCDNCGKVIDIARLEAIPHTSLCMRCAETRDYHNNR
ncbi:MAG: hypothetical protein Kow00120_21560 [Anaerolineae bacterium]